MGSDRSPVATAKAVPASPTGVSRETRGKLDTFSQIVLLGGSFLALGALGFIFFLWFGEGSDSGKNAASLWRWIVLQQRLAQAITVLTLVLRVVMVAQISICTSLVAALVLERHGIPLFCAAELSMLRSTNDGPRQLAWLLLTSGPRSAVLPKMVITVLFLCFLALQFSSTILISDLGYGSIVGSHIEIAMGTSMTDETTHQSGFPNAFAYSPVPIPFGEIQVSLVSTSRQQGRAWLIPGSYDESFLHSRQTT